MAFYQLRDFTPDVFKAFMYAQSQPFPEMIELMRGLKTQHGLQIVAVSNERRELTTYRVQQFNHQSTSTALAEFGLKIGE